MSAAQLDPAFEALLAFLKRSRGSDFTGYKRASLERRFRRRMDAVGCTGFGDYLDHLEVHPEEYEALFDTLLINVTEFFRDPPAWQYLRDEVLPGLLRRGDGDEQIRVWSAGCASGEEAYTIAMLLAEALDPESFRNRVKIYATDLDEDALDTARQAVYMAGQIEHVPPALRERYFERADQRFAFRKDLRRSVIFGRNNLVQDAPISRLDLLMCRNTLMYFTAETQGRILRHFDFALRESGALMLGKSEMMMSHRDLFTPVDLRQRIFAKRDRARSPQARVAGVTEPAAARARPDDERVTRDLALELGPVPTVVVSGAGLLTFANAQARSLFGLAAADVGRPFRDLDVSFRPAELRRPVEEALGERRRIAVGEVGFSPAEGELRRLDIVVAPLLSEGDAAVGVSVVFEDVTSRDALQREVEGHRRELEQVYDELQATIDEVETTNEELQTTNEELQSTNEELETMNEELRSTNEELETINDELRERTTELNRLNDLLEAIFSSLGVAVAVLDRQQLVQVWNHRAQDLWGLHEDEAVEQHFVALDIGLPTERIAQPLRAVIGGASGRERLEVEAVNRRGRTITCTTTILPLVGAAGVDGDRETRGAIVVMEDGFEAGYRG